MRSTVSEQRSSRQSCEKHPGQQVRRRIRPSARPVRRHDSLEEPVAGHAGLPLHQLWRLQMWPFCGTAMATLRRGHVDELSRCPKERADAMSARLTWLVGRSDISRTWVEEALVGEEVSASQSTCRTIVRTELFPSSAGGGALLGLRADADLDFSTNKSISERRRCMHDLQ